jgi:outer membrane protein OmpA-like peptidoglycan-associated protein
MSDQSEWEDAGSMEAGGHVGPWPAFVDLFAATTLVLLVFFVVIAYRYIGEVGDAVKVRQLVATLEEMKRSGGQFEVQKQGADVLLILEERVTFQTGQAVLLEPAKETLREVVTILRRDKFKGLVREIEILGHADRRGDPVSNWRLSANRAVSVADFLVHSVGSNPCTIIASGRGAYFPRDTVVNIRALPPAQRQAEYARDRRVEIVLHPAVARDRETGRSGCLRSVGDAVRTRIDAVGSPSTGTPIDTGLVPADTATTSTDTSTTTPSLP